MGRWLMIAGEEEIDYGGELVGKKGCRLGKYGWAIWVLRER